MALQASTGAELEQERNELARRVKEMQSRISEGADNEHLRALQSEKLAAMKQEREEFLQQQVRSYRIRLGLIPFRLIEFPFNSIKL